MSVQGKEVAGGRVKPRGRNQQSWFGTEEQGVEGPVIQRRPRRSRGRCQNELERGPFFGTNLSSSVVVSFLLKAVGSHQI